MCDFHLHDSPFGIPDCDNCHKKNLESLDNFLTEQFLLTEEENPLTSQELEEKINLGKNGQNLNSLDYVWVTVNPRKEVSLQDLLKNVHKMYKKVWIEKALYIFEIGATKHNHSHGIIQFKPGMSKAKIIQQLANSVKSITNTEINNCFCVRFVTQEQAKKNINYMLGQKQQEKMQAVKDTLEWRVQNNILPYYTSGDISLLVPEITLI